MANLSADLRTLLDKVVARSRDRASAELARKLHQIAEDHAHRGFRGAALAGAQTAAIIDSATSEASQVSSDVLRACRDSYGGSLPDDVAVSVREYLLALADGLANRLTAAVTLKTLDIGVGPEIAARAALALKLNFVRDVDIELGPAMLRASARRVAASALASYDAFVSHATEDKATVVDDLVVALRQRGLNVWYDQAALTVGDSLPQKIDEGLKLSRFGVVVLSPDFFKKGWPRNELDALSSRQATEQVKVILPVWHNVTREDVAEFSPMLASRVAARTILGIDKVAASIVDAIERSGR